MMEPAKYEPMKHRFKKRHLWKFYHEAYFVDDAMDYGGTGLDVIRQVRKKPHSHDWGHKPSWRHARRFARRVNARRLTDINAKDGRT
jgi:hypothetical protein